VALACAAALALTPLFFVSTLIRQRAAHAMAERTGLATSVDAASFGWSGVTLSGVHLRPEPNVGLAIDVQSVAVKLDWLGALVDGAGAVSAVSADGVEAEVDLKSDAFAALRDKFRSGGESNGGSHKHRTLEATHFSLTAREGKEELLVVEGSEAHLEPTEITASLDRLRARKPGLASAAMSGVEISLNRGAVLQLQRLAVEEASLSITTPTPLAAGAAASVVEPEPNDDPDAPTPQPTAADAAKPHHRRESVQAFMARLAPDAELSLHRARIEQVVGKSSVPILNDVSCDLHVLPDGAVRVTGKGAASAGGRLDVDMRVWPADLRADGRIALAALPLTLLVPVLPSVPWYEPEKSRIDASLTIKAESPARVAIEGRAELKNGSLSSERLATGPVEGIEVSLAGRGHWLPTQRRLEIASASVGLGKAKADIKGSVEWAADHFAFDIDSNLPATPCTDAVRSIPNALLGDMALAQWRGNIAGKLRFQTDSRELDKTVLNVDITDRCDFHLVPVMADLSRFSKPFTHTVEEPDGTIFEMETGPGTDNWTPIEAMSPYFIYAVMVHEDPQFFNHHGFSPISIRNALVRDLRERRYALGASTITMQLVKNIFLHREKTLARKIQEVLLTWWTERVMEKRDILELYLNVIEYGPSIYGVRNAARHYWNRLPSELSPGESVFLATILPNPKHFHTYYERNNVPASWLANMRSMLRRLNERGAYDKESFDYGLSELEHFKFSRDGQPAEPRVIPGGTAPLPYQKAAQSETFDANTFGQAGRF
jgi:hypothetical protein